MDLDFDKLFNDVSKMKVAVIGDVMLDTYWWGNVERISPEAPVPVVAVSKREKRIGGAGNVALNVQSLGASVALITILGDDEDGVQLKQLMKEKNIDTLRLKAVKILDNFDLRHVEKDETVIKIQNLLTCITCLTFFALMLSFFRFKKTDQ